MQRMRMRGVPPLTLKTLRTTTREGEGWGWGWSLKWGVGDWNMKGGGVGVLKGGGGCSAVTAPVGGASITPTVPTNWSSNP